MSTYDNPRIDNNKFEFKRKQITKIFDHLKIIQENFKTTIEKADKLIKIGDTQAT